MGLCLVGVAGLVAPSFGQQQDAKVKAASNPAASTEASAARVAPKAAAIGSIDIEKVLKDYDKFKVANETIRAEALARHKSIMEIATEAKQEQEKYAKFLPGSPDAKKCEDRITQLKAQFEAGRENAEREFAQKEAEIMATIFNEISAMTKGAAVQRGLSFVVRYSDAPASGSEPNSVAAAMGRTVIFADPAADITAYVTYWLNQRYKESGGVAPKNTTVNLPPSPTNAAPRTGAAPSPNRPAIK
jgi:Skp family chaperone for outer membrane proteins